MAKTDPFGIATTGIQIDEVSDNASASVAEAHDETGSLVAHKVYGATLAPSATYKVTAAVSLTGVKLGAVTTYKTKRVVLTNVSVSTSAGGENTVTASGTQVEDDDDGTCPQKYSVPTVALGPCHHAKTLASAFTLSGTGCHLQDARISFSCDPGTTDVDGEVVAHGVHNGAGECQLTIVQVGEATPTVSPGTGWFISTPLSMSHSGAEYPTWTCTLRTHLSPDAQQTGS